jgi:hypothetical protein
MSTAVGLCGVYVKGSGEQMRSIRFLGFGGIFVGCESLLDCRAGSLGHLRGKRKRPVNLGRFVFLSGPTDRADISEKSRNFGR